VADDVELLLVLDFEGVEHERVARPSRGKIRAGSHFVNEI
jgi:hypothetical protein